MTQICCFLWLSLPSMIVARPSAAACPVTSMFLCVFCFGRCHHDWCAITTLCWWVRFSNCCAASILFSASLILAGAIPLNAAPLLFFELLLFFQPGWLPDCRAAIHPFVWHNRPIAVPQYIPLVGVIPWLLRCNLFLQSAWLPNAVPQFILLVDVIARLPCRNLFLWLAWLPNCWAATYSFGWCNPPIAVPHFFSFGWRNPLIAVPFFFWPTWSPNCRLIVAFSRWGHSLPLCQD